MTKQKTKATCCRVTLRNAHRHPLVWAMAAFVVIAGLVWTTNIKRTYAGITINTNVASLDAQRQLAKTQEALSKSFERLSSGLRINSASDDAAGLGVSEDLQAQVRALESARQNTAAASTLLTLTEDATARVNAAISNGLSLLGSATDARTTPTKKRNDAAAKIRDLNTARALIIKTRKTAAHTPFTEEAADAATTADAAFQSMNKPLTDAANAMSVYFGFARGKKLSVAAVKAQMEAAAKTVEQGKREIVDAAMKINDDAEEEEQRAEEYINEQESNDASDTGTTGDESEGSTQDESSGDTEDGGN